MVQSSHGEDTKYYDVGDRRRSPPRYERSILERLHGVSRAQNPISCSVRLLTHIADDRLASESALMCLLDWHCVMQQKVCASEKRGSKVAFSCREPWRRAARPGQRTPGGTMTLSRSPAQQAPRQALTGRCPLSCSARPPCSSPAASRWAGRCWAAPASSLSRSLPEI